jgi:tetratricopeptide (TPR) repeat protein
LGNALESLGEREAGTKRLKEAVISYREALKEYTQEHVPLNWAKTQNNLGNALCNIGEREADTQHLDEAVICYREAIKERTRERVPLDWAQSQYGLGNALRSLGERTKNVLLLEQALTTIQSSYNVYKTAGYNQYNNDFDKKLQDIAALIAKLR